MKGKDTVVIVGVVVAGLVMLCVCGGVGFFVLGVGSFASLGSDGSAPFTASAETPAQLRSMFGLDFSAVTTIQTRSTGFQDPYVETVGLVNDEVRFLKSNGLTLGSTVPLRADLEAGVNAIKTLRPGRSVRSIVQLEGVHDSPPNDAGVVDWNRSAYLIRFDTETWVLAVAFGT